MCVGLTSSHIDLSLIIRETSRLTRATISCVCVCVCDIYRLTPPRPPHPLDDQQRQDMK